MVQAMSLKRKVAQAGMSANFLTREGIIFFFPLNEVMDDEINEEIAT
jgi:hypothetical protein